MTTLLEDAIAHSSDQGTDMHHKGGKDLIMMLEEFSKPYSALAIAYNQLRSETSYGLHSESLSYSNTAETQCGISKKKATCNLEGQNLEEDWRLKSTIESPNIKFDSTNLNLGQMNKLEDEHHELIQLTTAEPRSMKYKAELECIVTQSEESANFSTNENFLKEIQGFEIEDPSMNHYKFDSPSSMLQFQITKLTEDNHQQLVELVRRNDEKRETIKRLQIELEALKRENKALQTSLRYSNAGSEYDQPPIPMRGRISMRKLFGGCSP